MTLETGIVAKLTGLVGDRIYPRVAPAKAASPYITYTAAGLEIIGRTQDDAVKPHQRRRIQVDCWAMDSASGETASIGYDDVMALRAQVIAALDGIKGDYGGETVLAADLVDDRDASEAESGPTWRRSLDFLFIVQGA